jgi:nitrite reductase/ring-hydroxylating ferredoxin subunit
MLSREDNETLCRVGPGTAMGAVMREYWIPAGLASELPNTDGTPVRIRLLGENLVAFRDTDGRIGLIQENCPHRGASLFFGRNEESGLRCVYHGWKFNAAGTCVDMPNEPPESNFKHKVRVTAYPCVERGGIVWTYMGPRQTPPPLPNLEASMLPDGEYTVQVMQRECNWMQALEGDIDTGHTVFLHLGAMQPEDAPEGSYARLSLEDRAPHYESVDTDIGTMYGCYRPLDEQRTYWRIAQFLFPFYAMIPTGILGLEVRYRAWVPMDDGHTLAYSVNGVSRYARSVDGRPAPNVDMLPNATDWYGRFRCVDNAANGYNIDRDAQATGKSYTGISAIFIQDQAVTESMGEIYDRTKERLGTSDLMIIRTRRRLINVAKALRDHGTPPPGVDDPTAWAQRTGSVVLPTGANWVDSTAELRKGFVDHPELSRDPLGGIAAV